MTQKTWVLLRGLARESRHWGPFLEDFERKFPNDQVIALDLPGAGEFRDVRPPFSIGGVVVFLRSELKKRGVKLERIHLFSTSLGGMVAISWLAQHPEEVEKIVVLNSSSRLSVFYRRLRWESWPQFFNGVTQADSKMREERILNLITNSDENRQKALPHWIKIANEHTIPFQTALFQLAAASRFQVPQKKWPREALFLVGLGDRLVEPQCSMELAEHFGAPLQKHPWGGHDLTTDDPSWVLNQVAHWLDSGT